MSGRVFLAPRLRLARLKLANILLEHSGMFEGVALPCPRELERVLNLYVRGTVGFQRVVDSVRGVLQGFSSSWLWVEEPLLLALPRLGVKVVACYLRSASEALASAMDLVSLAFRGRVSGKFNVEEWRKTVSGEGIEAREGWAAIASRSVKGVEASDVWGLPYPPPEALSPEDVSEEKIKEYIDYIFDYILVSHNLDEAYLRWLEERRGIRKPELWRLLRLASGVARETL